MIKINEQYCNGLHIKENSWDISLTKITFTFNKRWYEKYDVFKHNNQEYICISRPRKNEDDTWSIDVTNSGTKLNPDTEFIINTVSELNYTNEIS